MPHDTQIAFFCGEGLRDVVGWELTNRTGIPAALGRGRCRYYNPSEPYNATQSQNLSHTAPCEPIEAATQRQADAADTQIEQSAIRSPTHHLPLHRVAGVASSNHAITKKTADETLEEIQLHTVLIDARGVNDVDLSGIHMLTEMVNELNRQDLALVFCNTNDLVKKRLLLSPIKDKLPEQFLMTEDTQEAIDFINSTEFYALSSHLELDESFTPASSDAGPKAPNETKGDTTNPERNEGPAIDVVPAGASQPATGTGAGGLQRREV